MNKLIIRPSTINDWVNCSWKWYNTYILGMVSRTNSSAAIGTAIHAAAESYWRSAIAQQEKPTINLDKFVEVAEDKFVEINQEQEMNYEGFETYDSAMFKVKQGAELYLASIAPKLEIPTHIEHRVTVKMDHPLVESISGTIDFLDEKRNILADIKTSKRAIVPNSYCFQQSLYTYLAQKNGFKIYINAIHGIVFTKEPRAEMHTLETNIEQAKNIVNVMLDTLRAFADGGDPKILFRGNPKYYLCSYKYCDNFNKCLYTGNKEHIVNPLIKVLEK